MRHLNPTLITRRQAIIAGATALAPLLPGCNTTGGKDAQVSSNGTLRYPLSSPPTTLDPALVEDGTTIDLLQNIYEGLVKLDEKSRTIPGIAEKWTVSDGGLTYTFNIRQGVKFHNDREVTASDFQYSLERACDPSLNSQTVFSYLGDIVGANDKRNGKAKTITGISVPSTYVLQIKITRPISYWIDKMTYPTGYVVYKEAIEANGGKIDATSTIGAGPFKLAKAADYNANYQVLLSKHASYYAGSPKLDHIERPVLQSPVTRISKFESGSLDMVKIAPSDLDHVNGDPKLKPGLHLYPRAATWYLGLNQSPPGSPFTDKRVRLAFNMAIDRQQVVHVALKDKMSAATSIVPPGMGDYHSTCTLLPFNPAKAKELLAEAGYGPNRPFPVLALTYRNDYQWVADSAAVIANQLKQNLGITVQNQPMEWGEFLDALDKKSMPFCLERWEADYLDPQDFLSVLLHTSRKINGQWDHTENNTGYSNPQFDRLCDAADVEQNQTARFAMYQQAEQIAVDDGPWVPVFFQTDLELDAPRVTGIRDSLLGHLPYTTTTVSG